MENFASYLANLPKTPLTEAIQSLYESYYGQWNFKSVQELRDFVDQKTYERFNLYSKDEVASGKTPFGSLEAIKAVDMDTFLKSVGDKGYDIVDDMKNQLVDANYINNLSYDWFICLFNMKVLGWNPSHRSGDISRESYRLLKERTNSVAPLSAMNNSLDNEDFDDGVHYSEDDPDPFQDA